MSFSSYTNAAAGIPTALTAHWDTALFIGGYEYLFDTVARMVPRTSAGQIVSYVVDGFRELGKHYVLQRTIRSM